MFFESSSESCLIFILCIFFPRFQCPYQVKRLIYLLRNFLSKLFHGHLFVAVVVIFHDESTMTIDLVLDRESPVRHLFRVLNATRTNGKEAPKKSNEINRERGCVNNVARIFCQTDEQMRHDFPSFGLFGTVALRSTVVRLRHCSSCCGAKHEIVPTNSFQLERCGRHLQRH